MGAERAARRLAERLATPEDAAPTLRFYELAARARFGLSRREWDRTPAAEQAELARWVMTAEAFEARRLAAAIAEAVTRSRG